MPGDGDAQPDGYVSGPGATLTAATDAPGADVDQPASATAFASTTLFEPVQDLGQHPQFIAVFRAVFAHVIQAARA